MGQNSRGAKTRVNASGKDYYGFIRETACPSVIVECAFVDSTHDLKILATEGDRKKVGKRKRHLEERGRSPSKRERHPIPSASGCILTKGQRRGYAEETQGSRLRFLHNKIEVGIS